VRLLASGTAAAAALLAAVALAGCLGGVSPLECAVDGDCAGGFCTAGTCSAGTRSCPALQPTFSSINRSLLQVGCGVKQNNCHADGSTGVGSGPSFSGHPFRTLVGAPAANVMGTARGLILVKPGDPGNSFLLTKLRLTDTANPLYGSGQPASAPGSICAAAQDVIALWIAQGAEDN
jgi:hypothetical protein